jgi:hypothetical protein
MHAEETLNRVPSLLDLSAELVAELVVGEFLDLLESLVNLVRVLPRKVLGLLEEFSEFWHSRISRMTRDNISDQVKVWSAPAATCD